MTFAKVTTIVSLFLAVIVLIFDGTASSLGGNFSILRNGIVNELPCNYMSFANCKLSTNDIKRLGRVIDEAEDLKTLILQGNIELATEGVEIFSNAISKDCGVETLNVSHCHLI